MHGRARVILLVLLASFAGALLFGCMPYELRAILDGPQGKALSISPSAMVVPASNTVGFTAVGGVGPYTYSVASGVGVIDPVTGAYTAPVTAGSAVIRVTDKTGKTVDATITIQAVGTGLAISPASITLGIGASMTFVPIGGSTPYAFAITTNVSGAAPMIGAVYIAGSTTGDDVVTLTDGASTTITAAVHVVPLSTVDYAITGTTFAGSGTVSTALPGGQKFALANIGTSTGTSADWRVYLSANAFLDAGDFLISSGTELNLSASGSVTPTVTGAFPAVAPGPYYLIVQVSSADDTTPGNNTSAASPITLNPKNIDYVVNPVSSTGGTTAGAGMTGDFTIHNQGTAAGGAIVFWQVRASVDLTLDASDYIVAGGSIPGVSGSTTSAPITVNGTWPSTPGPWYLFAFTIAVDDIDNLNNVSAATLVTTTGVAPANVEYTVTSVTNLGGVTAGKAISGSFDFKNNGTNGGAQQVYWTAYVSVDSTLQLGTDTVIDSGIVGPLGPPTPITGTVPFTGTWPAAPGPWHLIVSISASDDVIPTNNITSSGLITTTPPNVDYSVVSPLLPGPQTAGDPLSGSFKYRNTGTQDGSQTVVWTAYLSTDATLQIGTDTVIDSGLVGPLTGSSTSAAATSFSGTWPSAPASWFVIISLTVAEDVNTSDNTSSIGAIGTTAPIVDYTVTSVTAPAPGTAGGPLSGTVTFRNVGTHAGTQFVPWRAYVSTDATLQIGTDVLICSGFLPFPPGLAAGAFSAAIPYSGTWPASATTQNYRILIEVGAGDDVSSLNNLGASLLVAVTGVTPAYTIIAVPAPAGVITGQAVSGTFTIQNVGNGPGSANVIWQVYASLGNGTYDAGDTLIGSGFFGGLNTSSTNTPVYAGTWPAAPGNYQIIVRASAADAAAIPDAASPSVAVANPPQPDYTAIFSMAIPWSGLVGTAMSLTGTPQMTIQNQSATNAGNQTITWAVYLSTNNVLEVGDTLVQQGSVGPLAASGSTTVSFAANWPAAPGQLYFLIATVLATDDGNVTNNVVIAPHACAIADYRYVETAGGNDGVGPSPPGGQTSNTGVAALAAGQTIAIEGLMDAFNGYDTYKFVTAASMTRLSIRAMWETGYDDLDLYLWDTGATNLKTNEVGINAEPGGGTFDVISVTGPRTCYISANFWLANDSSGSMGQKYVILVRGVP
jgi:hypothetical protein